MNPYKGLTQFFRGLLWVVTLGLLLMLVIPSVQYRLKTPDAKAITLASDEAEGIHWILDNRKIEVDENNLSSLIFVDNADDFNPELMAEINYNVLLAETLYSQFGGDLSKHIFLDNLFESTYTGYVGKTCTDLSDRREVPEAAIATYEATYGRPWRYYGQGIVLTNETDVIVLVEGDDYIGHLNFVSDNQTFSYEGYFEIIELTEDTSARFSIEVTEEGRQVLESLGLPDIFSAEITVSNRVFDGVYHSGQFSKIPVTMPSAYSSMAALMKNKMIFDEHYNESLYWKWYYPKIASLLKHEKDSKPYYVQDKGDGNLFYADNRQFYITDDKGARPFFMKGVNLGAALPGKTFTEFPVEKAVYVKWLEQMAQLNINTLRVYTLLPPVFYQALYEFNESHETPIYLLQEIWPEEYPLDHNYLGQAYNETYKKEIEYAVHAIHGNINIPMRDYRSNGIYKYDVSPYLIGYLVGREMEPEEVQATDTINEGYEFNGRYLYGVKGATPTETWLAQSCDYALAVEEQFYEDRPLVAIVSWPTLDPVTHVSEWSPLTGKTNKFNDNTVVDINNIGVHQENVSGFFGAYHIYPNYPDFMNNELTYNAYEDEKGRFRYGGYLQEFMAGHKKYPAVVAEYGIATSQVTAHISPDDYDHGGLTEEEQAEGIIRMTDAIVREGYSGAIIFEWMDEWAKKTWTTEPYMIPYAKNPFWHNVLDPEQNYGLVAVEAVEPEYTTPDADDATLSFGQNASFVYLELSDTLKGEKYPIEIAIDTVKEEDEEEVAEFLLRIGPTSELLANPGYNWINGYYHSIATNYEVYQPLIQMTNGENVSMLGDVTPERSVNLSVLRYGEFENPRANVYFDGVNWTVRIPYGLLGISDPSENEVLWDETVLRPIARDEITTVTIDAIDVMVINDNSAYTFELEEWTTPTYQTRYKNSFDSLSDYFKQLN